MESAKVELAMGNAVSDAAQGAGTHGFCGATSGVFFFFGGGEGWS